MKEWCMTHWFLTFVIICIIILVVEGVIANICRVIITFRGKDK